MEKKTISARNRATMKYIKTKTTRVALQLFPKDADIRKKLDSEPNKNGYIKRLIRADIAANGCGGGGGADAPALSYDYSKLLGELREEVADGVLALDDRILIVREGGGDAPGYRPIVDWLYDDIAAERILAQGGADAERYRRHFDEVREKAKSARVEDVIKEMVRMDKVL